MALIQCNFYSDTLGLSTSMHVILPQQTHNQIGMENVSGQGLHPTLYLLHGLSDDDSIWLRRTSIERYVADLGIAVVMPQVHRSFYTDMVEGGSYWTFISEELPALARSFFPLSHKREDNFVAGLSMGGYGAFKLALRKPDQYAAAASLSGALDMTAHLDNMKSSPLWRAEMERIFGPKIAGSENDLLQLLKDNQASSGPRPLLYQCCGTEDFLYDQNQSFREACAQTDLQLTYEEEPGEHEWGYWDQKIQSVLKWLPLRERK
ncbi:MULTISPECIES: alpha/beta hydrolase [Paenibacillus]|uniref:S-formylglutathione hydrolase FrmB n=1 Tax=Paenibacillus pabuli TaxID=1472 RepID=A0A855XWK3_9BACL|nr:MULTISPECIES: alpha/beta hydrolase family protein [Paenibacillus]PWW37472.1 S-formylglutathione hydrolase FrmB [Paenibacillus pabuli]PXW05613.1 S-formylglutathione hydrolase FrmB [Paenibacillus taichungensis]RAI84336.1 S-formylglutathione hydrolase FrmB [Paenibacillus pabuli]